MGCELDCSGWLSTPALGPLAPVPTCIGGAGSLVFLLCPLGLDELPIEVDPVGRSLAWARIAVSSLFGTWQHRGLKATRTGSLVLAAELDPRRDSCTAVDAIGFELQKRSAYK